MFNFFDKLKNTVSKTAQALVGNVVDSVSEEEEFSDFVLDDMEDLLISADLGVNYASELVDKLRGQSNIKPGQVKEFLKTEKVYSFIFFGIAFIIMNNVVFKEMGIRQSQECFQQCPEMP